MILVFLALTLALTCAGGFGEEAAKPLHVQDYDVCETPAGLLQCGQLALEDGMPGQQVLEEMYAIADAGNYLEQFEATCENIAAYGNKTYNKLQEVLEGEEGNYASRRLDVFYAPAAEDSDRSWSAYDMVDVSDEMRELLKDSKAQYCFEPYYWPEEDFKTVLGTAYSKFTPAKARPAYACVVIRKGAQCQPETAWNKGDNDDFLYAMNDIVNGIAVNLYEDSPVFTGNPNLASTFWVFDVSYTFYSWYGNKEVKGYNLDLSLTIEDASSKKSLAKLKYSEKLGSTIYYWDDGIAKPDFPQIYDITSFDSTVGKIRALMQKQRGEAAATRKITSMNAEKVLNGVLVEQGGKIDDAWQKAIWECGAQDVALDGDTLAFTLRTYNPDPKSLGAYAKAEDKASWLNAALENTKKYDLAASLTLEDGQPTSKSISALKKVIKSAALTAQEAFEGDDMTAAIIERMFPTPVSGKITNAEQLLTPDDSFIEWLNSRDYRLSGQEPAVMAALFASQKTIALETKNGPKALVIKVTAAEPAEILSTAAKTVLDKLAYLTELERDEDATEADLKAALVKAALSAKKNAKAKYEFPVDLDQMWYGDYPAEYWQYVESFAFTDTLWQLNRKIQDLPAMAAEEMPKSGIMRGGKSGTEVTLKLSKNSSATYVQIRKDGTDELAATVFIHPGKSVTLHLQKGYYCIYYCSGPYWYGEEDLFCDLGSYSKSEPTEIKGTNYTHTFTLESSADGDVSIYGSDPSEFIKP